MPNFYKMSEKRNGFNHQVAIGVGKSICMQTLSSALADREADFPPPVDCDQPFSRVADVKRKIWNIIWSGT